jgi:short-subunit dehydrogenase
MSCNLAARSERSFIPCLLPFWRDSTPFGPHCIIGFCLSLVASIFQKGTLPVFERYGRIDILINNAGQSAGGNVADVDIDQFRQIFELNVLGIVEAMQAIIPKMRQKGGGLIINVSSMVTKMHLPAISAYAATKAALNMISDTAREELASENIRITTMFPRRTATNFGKNSLTNPKTNQGPRPPQGGPEPDSAEAVALKILEAARNEPHDQYMDR